MFLVSERMDGLEGWPILDSKGEGMEVLQSLSYLILRVAFLIKL